MTWEIVTGLIVLVGFIITIGSIIYKLGTILSKLETAVDNLRETITSVKDNNSKEHERFFDMIEKLDRRLTILETRFSIESEENEPSPSSRK